MLMIVRELMELFLIVKFLILQVDLLSVKNAKMDMLFQMDNALKRDAVEIVTFVMLDTLEIHVLTVTVSMGM